MTRIYLLIFSLLYFASLNSQILPNRYVEEVFSSYTETSEVQFSTSVPQPKPGGGFYEWITGYPLNAKEWDTTNEDLFMDIFEPPTWEDTIIEKRPLVIICFGGGFLGGSKDHWSMREIAAQLTKRGYVTAIIDYRLGMNIFDEDLSKRAPYRGLQDGRSAVRYFKADAAGSNTYKIDTSNIYIGGHSSGAFIALHNAYLDKEGERPLSTYDWLQDGNTCDDLLCIDCVGDNTDYVGNARAVFSLAGALGSVDFIESGDMPPVVMFHSEDDGTVPYDSGEPFSSILWAVIGDDLPVVYGSQAIADEADIVGLDYVFNSYTNRGHDVHEETGSDLYSDIISTISDSFYYKLLKPVDHPIMGGNIICDDQLTLSYHSLDNEAKYYDWQVEGGVINSPDSLSNTIEVTWDPAAISHKLYLTPYSCTGARGAKDSLELQINPQDINTWSGSNGNWSDPSNWSLGHLPLTCEDVRFEDADPAQTITITPTTEAVARSIIVGDQVSIHVQSGSSLSLLTGGGLTVKGEITIQDTVYIQNLRPPYTEHLDIIGELQILNLGSIELGQ